MVMITPATCRAARGLVDWTQRQLADAARVGLSTVKGFEGGTSAPIGNNLRAIQEALEGAGIVFIAENGGGAGVRFKAGQQGSKDGHDPATAGGRHPASSSDADTSTPGDVNAILQPPSAATLYVGSPPWRRERHGRQATTE